MKIYIIEDDKKLRAELVKLLSAYKYDCSFDDDYENIISLALEKQPDLILLDVNLPVFDGYYICREIRKQSDVPIIIVTSRSTDMDELMSMNLGADDFITKPYHSQILLAHISAVLKRCNSQSVAEKVEYRGLTLYPSQSKISYQENETDLTKNEMKILTILINNAGRIVSRSDLMNALWQSDEFVDDNTLTVNVNRLRKRIKEIGAPELITTKRGLGYIL
ncbi:response regulator transcription factor [Massiliimalia timonensis]|uniref:Stage 0 sporulation protein A homolog n=1 Tax=Massiliimalia timonensis TaxID=1987501 RepID=A0A8J6P1E1_9FIRM|nr:response regulator transcription factor [Massiliimalia timonensis]MBC8611106.1 response regulator transcription factor [Massiliimalia timonensis]